MAEVKTVVVELAPETQDVCAFALKAVKYVKEKKALAELLPEVVKAVDGIANIPQEAQTKTWAFVKTLVLFGADLAELLVKHDEVVTVPGKA
jgi:hypothetical protein